MANYRWKAAIFRTKPLLLYLTFDLNGPKESAGPVDVFADLGPQLFNRRKLNFVAKSLQKANLNYRVRVQREGMEIEQVTLNGKRIHTKGRSIAYICHGIKQLRAHTGPRDVHAMFGN
jgi:aspartate carbamoyltransferase catalytic subunit